MFPQQKGYVTEAPAAPGPCQVAMETNIKQVSFDHVIESRHLVTSPASP